MLRQLDLEQYEGADMEDLAQTMEAMLVCLGPDARARKLVRSAARLAAQLDVPWHCIYVETPRLQRLRGD